MDATSVILVAIAGAICAALAVGLWARGQLKPSRERVSELERERRELLDQQESLRRALGAAEQDRARFEERAERVPELERTLEEKEKALESLHGETRSLGEQGARLKAELEEIRRTASERRELLTQKEDVVASLQGELKTLSADKASLSTALEEQGRAAAEKLDLLNSAEEKLREAFQALSAEALKSNNQAFLDLARAQLGEFQQGAKSDLEERQRAIGQLVSPIQQSLEKVQGVIQDVEKERAEAYGELREQVKGLAVTQRQLHSETANLVKALRSPSVRGRWGEIQLRRVVEMAGMVDHCDFFEQESKEADGGRLRPDLIVNLPGGRRVVVDSKVPLTAYLSSVESEDESAREAFLGEHSRQVRAHIVKLASKGYWEQFEPTPDFVVMFLPGEAFFSAALQRDPELIEYGVEQRVVPASPLTLIALLRAVAYGWRQERVAENARLLSELGRELYDRLGVFVGHLRTVGTGLGRAVEAYNDAVGSLERRVLVQARRFKDLGATAAGDLPELPLLETSPRALPAGESPDAGESGAEQ